ncbi:MAG TPA: hypothetical protein VGV14_17830 [Rhodanobacter sp.]|nr:hypothetical protein [Rhodanobacter sp.]
MHEAVKFRNVILESASKVVEGNSTFAFPSVERAWSDGQIFGSILMIESFAYFGFWHGIPLSALKRKSDGVSGCCRKTVGYAPDKQSRRTGFFPAQPQIDLFRLAQSTMTKGLLKTPYATRIPLPEGHLVTVVNGAVSPIGLTSFCPKASMDCAVLAIACLAPESKAHSGHYLTPAYHVG